MFFFGLFMASYDSLLESISFSMIASISPWFRRLSFLLLNLASFVVPFLQIYWSHHQPKRVSGSLKGIFFLNSDDLAFLVRDEVVLLLASVFQRSTN